MAKSIIKKNKIDFISVTVFLSVILIMPIVLFFGVLKPQTLENKAAGLTPSVTIKTVPGDVNRDGVLNGRDATLMLTELAKPVISRSLKFDLNGDGVIDSRDYTFMLEAMKVYGDE